MPATQDPQYYVYLLTNRTRTLYVGVTNDLERRVYQHRSKLVPPLYEQVQRHPAHLLRADLRREVGNSAGEADQGLEKK